MFNCSDHQCTGGVPACCVLTFDFKRQNSRTPDDFLEFLDHSDLSSGICLYFGQMQMRPCRWKRLNR